MKLDIDKLDFDRCEDERIHQPELIQSYGYFIASNSETGKIEIVSENITDLLGDSQNLLGSNFFDLLDEGYDLDFLTETYSRAKSTETRLPLRITFKSDCVTGNQENDYYAVVYTSNGLMIVEIEPSDEFRETYSAQQHMKLYATSIAPRFKQFNSLDEMAMQMVNTLRFVTNMDRVVLYKFKEDGSGKVIAESKIDGIDSYLDLHYPAADIPKQARDLYMKNWIRLMANIDLEPSKLIPTPQESGREPIDMTHSLLRDLSPIHKQYMRNQGIQSSLSMSLVTHGHLWGMIACHSHTPRYIAQNIRLECENLSQLFSWHLYAKEEEIYLARKEKTDEAILKVLDMTMGEKSIIQVFEENEEDVLSVLDADGFFFYTDTEQINIGNTPHLSVIKELFQNHCKDKNAPFSTRDMTEYIKDTRRLNGLSGILMVPLANRSKYFTAWFRKESPELQKWAGAPQEKSPTASKTERLTPRTSFQVHEKRVTGYSKPWDQYDEDVALRYNKVFMSYSFERQESLSGDVKYLELQNKYVNEFLATLAHELRNPLAPITLGLALLEDEENHDNRQEYMTTMKRQVDHMTTMIDDLMDVSRITQNKVKLSKENIDLRFIVQEAIESCQPLISLNDHKLELKLSEKPCMVYGDQTRLTQVIVNLLNNAAKYTEPGGLIETSLENKDGMVTVTVKDNGLGIEKNQLSEIFTMFTQMNALSSQSKSGLGIGLTLVKRLVEMHDGEVTAFSKGLGHGSTFSISFPKTADTADTSVQKKEKEAANSSNNQRHKVLVVDDNEDLVSLLSHTLSKTGYVVKTALNATNAVDTFAEFQPHYAILDLGLPEMDGFELLEKLKPLGESTVFFSHSGLSQKDKVERSARMGFKKHFVKPVSKKILMDALVKHRPNGL